MFENIKHPKTGEQLYQIIKVESNELKPYINIATMEECQKLYQQFTEEKDDNSWYVKKGHERIHSDGTCDCSLIVNHKGWGFDYMRMVIIDRVYMDI